MSTCDKPTQEDVNKYCNRQNGLSMLNLIPLIGPAISSSAGKSDYFNGKINDYQDEVNSISAKYTAEQHEGQKAIEKLVGENTQNIHNLINLLFGDGGLSNGYIDALINKKMFPLWEIAGYTSVTVICMIIILSVLITNE